MSLNFKDRAALKDWAEHKRSIELATVIDTDEDSYAKTKRIEALKADHIAFFKYYFPHYCKSDFNKHQIKFFKKAIKYRKITLSRAWARSHAKSVCAGVLLPMFLWADGEIKNMMLASITFDNAADLLTPLKLEFESNQRLINDFGKQQGLNRWEHGKFITINGCSFKAVGIGQSPRGTRNEDSRPDFILVDDIDDDESCRNPDRVLEGFKWVNGALRGCFDIVGNARFIAVGNIIAKNSIMKRLIELSDDHEQIDILHKEIPNLKTIKTLEKQLRENKDPIIAPVLKQALAYAQQGYEPSWPERFTLYDCTYMIIKMGYMLSQREYFNNPLNEGKTFKKEWMQFKALPPLRHYKYLIAYLDPGFKKTKTSDTKALTLIGMLNGEFHIRKNFCDQATVEGMIEWCYKIDEFVKQKNGTFRLFMEEVFLQDLLYKDFDVAAKKKYPLPVKGDKRKKPDKDARIESLTGYFERGSIYFDADIENDFHTQNLIEQFLTFEPGVRTKKDGPDSCEGAIHLLQNSIISSDNIETGRFKTNEKRV